MAVSVATTDDDGSHSRLQVNRGVPLTENGVEFIYFDRTTLTYKVSIDLARWLWARIGEFDVVHIHALFSFSTVAAAWAARRNKVPYIVRPLGVLNRWGIKNRHAVAKQLSLALIESRVVAGAAAMHYTTQREKIEAIEALPELAKIKSAVIPVPLFSPDPAANTARVTASSNKDDFIERYPELAGKQLVLFLSRIDAKKGLDLLVEAFARVAQATPSARLVIAGDGDQALIDQLKGRCARLGISQLVTWTGWMEPGTRDAALAAATLFVLPSHSENFGIAVAEALAAGAPVIVTEGVALADELKNSGAAVVVRGEMESLAGAMQQLLDDPTRRVTMAAAGKRLAQERFSIAQVGTRLKELYQLVVAGSSLP